MRLGPLREIQNPCASNPARCRIGIDCRLSYTRQVYDGFQVYTLTYSGNRFLAVRCIDDKSELAKCSADLMLKMLKCSSRGMHEDRVASDSCVQSGLELPSATLPTVTTGTDEAQSKHKALIDSSAACETIT